MKVFMTSVPSSDNPSNAPYSEESGNLSSSFKALLNIRVILVCMLFVLVLKFLHICAIRRDAKSLSAQWLSNSGRVQSWRETIHVVTEGINS